MAEEPEGDIEFLDEDADIVQQCVQSSPVDNLAPNFDIETELLIERLPHESKTNKRKRKIDRDDSDYDPSEDSKRIRKRKQAQNNAYQTQTFQVQKQNNSLYELNAPRQTGRIQLGNVKVKKDLDGLAQKRLAVLSELDLKVRRKYDIRVPDYEDPLCLPVRAVVKDKEDADKLKSWNNLCIEKFKYSDEPMRVEKDETVKSKRITVLRNLRTSQGKSKTTIYSVTAVQNKAGTKKTDLVQSVLPRYRERKVLNFKLTKKMRQPSFHHKTEVLLTQEINKDEEILVIYNPKESLSLVYKMYDTESDPNLGEEGAKKYLKEAVCCKMCAPCYQSSYRGYKTEDKNMSCHICKQPCVSAHSLVSHLKTHSHTEIRKYKNIVSKDLAESATYNYKCRICQKQFLSIKELRKHVNTHQGDTPFMCDVGKHIAQ